MFKLLAFKVYALSCITDPWIKITFHHVLLYCNRIYYHILWQWIVLYICILFNMHILLHCLISNRLLCNSCFLLNFIWPHVTFHMWGMYAHIVQIGAPQLNIGLYFFTSLHFSSLHFIMDCFYCTIIILFCFLCWFILLY